MQKVLVITMAHNEKIMLPIWVDYYAKNFGFEALLVLDHGSTDGSIENLPKKVNILRMPRDKFDDEERTAFVTSIVAAMHKIYDVVIYTDCDEILIPDPNKYSGLAEYCSKMECECVYAFGVNVRHVVHLENPIDLRKRILGQRRFCRFEMSMSKPLITRVPVVWNPGFHVCNVKPGMDKDLILFHLKYMDYAVALERLRYTRNMSWSEISIQKNRGSHQRMSDDELKARFDRDAIDVKRSNLKEFDFAEEERQISLNATMNSKGMYTRNIKWEPKLMRIPERFFGLV